VLEVGGIGPAPFAAMLLADMGADILRVDRPLSLSPDRGVSDPRFELLRRGRRSISLDLKTPAGIEAALALVDRADALIEGFRPGVAERLGIGPDVCLARNQALVYGRMTGWGQDGPLAATAGHDLNYIAVSGALHAIGERNGPPVPPLALVGDFGGGGMLLAFGLVSALLEARQSGHGQVVDAAVLEGVALLATSLYGFAAAGEWLPERGENLLDGGAPFYAVYETSDHKYVTIATLEPQFYAELVCTLGLDPSLSGSQYDRSTWPALRETFEAVFRGKTRDEWCQVMDGKEVCFAPVLPMAEAPSHPHNAARRVFVEEGGIVQPAPAPRLSRTPGRIARGPASSPGQHTGEALRDWGLPEEMIAAVSPVTSSPEPGGGEQGG
jgi:alpha-methylacyl-CoA racemase